MTWLRDYDPVAYQARAVRLLDQGLGVPEIARRLSIGEVTVRGWLKRQRPGAIMRPADRHLRSAQQLGYADTQTAVAALSEQGLTYSAVGRQLGGMCEDTVAAWLRRARAERPLHLPPRRGLRRES
jgi:transposase-like protein